MLAIAWWVSALFCNVYISALLHPLQSPGSNVPPAEVQAHVRRLDRLHKPCCAAAEGERLAEVCTLSCCMHEGVHA